MSADRHEERRIIMVSYPVPVMGGETVANLRLPKYLTREDADRIQRLVATLVLEDPSLSGGGGR